MPQVRIGISGWRYKPWRGEFYPPGLAQARELAFAGSRLNSIEINGSFYALQRPESFTRWRAEVPEDFVFAVKGPRFITHMKKLNDPQVPLANFFASGVLALGPKLGPILWQLPPNLGFRAQTLTAFLALLPRSTGQAARLAVGHDQRLEGRALTVTEQDRPLRHALEVRHASFAADPQREELLELLAAHRVALVVADTAGTWPYLEHIDGDLVYVRLHGKDELYTSGYTEQGLRHWADKVRGWAAEGRDVHVYFDNDVKVRAPFDAIALARMVGGLHQPAPA